MKKLFSIFILLITLTTSVNVHAQTPDTTTAIDSSVIEANIVLKESQLLLIADCLEQKTSDVLNFLAQVAKGMDTVYDANKSITVRVKCGFIRDVYTIMSVQQERFTSGVNDEIKAALLPQVINYSWLIRELQSLMLINSGLMQQRIQRSFATIKLMKV